MAHYAKVLDSKVVNIIVAEEDFFDAFVDETPGTWIQTSYNTHRGVHYTRNEDGSLGEPSDDQSKALRYNYAFIGGWYNYQADAFYPPQPYASWTLDTDIYSWVAPVAYPDDGEQYNWNEETQTWDAVESE
jgi:hypothetical protein